MMVVAPCRFMCEMISAKNGHVQMSTQTEGIYLLRPVEPRSRGEDVIKVCRTAPAC